MAVFYTQNTYGSLISQSYNYGSGYGHGGEYGYDHAGGNLRYHGPTAIPHVLKDGHIADTHEVAAAKAAHYIAIATAKAHSGYGYGDSYNYGGDYGYGGSYNHGNQEYSSYGGYGQHYSAKYADAYNTAPYYGPIAKPVVLKSGYLADTHEVAAAKDAHHKAVVSAKAHSGYGKNLGYGTSHGGYVGAYQTTPYHGPLARPVVLKSGYLADTHEVAAAKLHHLTSLHSTATHHYK